MHWRAYRAFGFLVDNVGKVLHELFNVGSFAFYVAMHKFALLAALFVFHQYTHFNYVRIVGFVVLVASCSSLWVRFHIVPCNVGSFAFDVAMHMLAFLAVLCVLYFHAPFGLCAHCWILGVGGFLFHTVGEVSLRAVQCQFL